MPRYRIKNWDELQHYKDRDPPWIKLYFRLLSSEDWVMLPDASKCVLIACMLIATRSKERGYIPMNPEYIKRVGNLQKLPDLQVLVDAGFMEIIYDDASTMHTNASTMRQNATPETETETEKKLLVPSLKTAQASAPEEVVMIFSVVGEPDTYELTTVKVREWWKTYGDSIHVLQSLRDAKQWIEDNPTRRKTARGMTRFLGGWIQRAINGGSGAPPIGRKAAAQEVARMIAATAADKGQRSRDGKITSDRMTPQKVESAEDVLRRLNRE